MTALFENFRENVLDVLRVVVLFGATGACRLLLTLGYEAVSAAACEVAFWEVELEASSHLRFDIVDLGVSEKVCALRISHDVDAVTVLYYVGWTLFV